MVRAVDLSGREWLSKAVSLDRIVKGRDDWLAGYPWEVLVEG